MKKLKLRKIIAGILLILSQQLIAQSKLTITSDTVTHVYDSFDLMFIGMSPHCDTSYFNITSNEYGISNLSFAFTNGSILKMKLGSYQLVPNCSSNTHVLIIILNDRGRNRVLKKIDLNWAVAYQISR